MKSRKRKGACGSKSTVKKKYAQVDAHKSKRIIQKFCKCVQEGVGQHKVCVLIKCIEWVVVLCFKYYTTIQ